MSSIFFLLSSKPKIKIFLICLAIGIPIILISIYVVTLYETSTQFDGIANDKGGMNYYYRETSGTEKLPVPIAKVLMLPPDSKATYINVDTDPAGTLSGYLTVFSPNDFSRIKTYFKTGATVIEEQEEDIKITRNAVKMQISKEKVREEDPKQGQTKYEIRFL
ncbi:hypothetical protein DBR32_07730 [Taibaiella sp. KBW10]|uniref:hypothetical protein n=1 Tax=Taibaiella sp. KBW10 TaxID=2153357 RepID=UPI000F597364|nr:hypothetical protein [Taibaiella sp. KBW10]RQO30616.1 hypothetical protein DBR32_07730 [Taibaiella sp. KBW10]